MKVYIDQGVDQKELKKLQKIRSFKIVQTDLEQQFSITGKVNKAFTIGRSTLDGPDVLAGDNISLVQEIVGKSKHEDISHIYSAWLNKCDYFITNNPDDFIRDQKREKLEQVLYPLKIVTLKEFATELGSHA
jgi:hypothetical protein